MRIFDDDIRRRLDALRAAVARTFAGDPGVGAAARLAGGRLEFRDHRPYTPGDDLRTLDWNLYGRLDELHVKRFHDETDLDVRIVIDRSASMGVLERRKDAYSLRVAAGLACALAGEGREIRVFALDSELTEIAPVVRRPDGIPRLLDRLEALPPCRGRAEGSRAAVLQRDPHRHRLVIVLSDFLDEGLSSAVLGGDRSRRVDAALGIVVAREERHPPTGGVVRLIGVEGEGRATVEVTSAVRDRFTRVFDLHLQEVARTAAARAASSVELACEEPFERAVSRLMRSCGVAR